MLKNISSMTFSELLIKLMNDKSLSTITLLDICKDRNIKQSIRNINRYKTGEVVPSYEDAKELISCFDENVEYKDLKKCLDYSRVEREEIKYKKKKNMLYKQVSISYNEFLIKQEPDVINMLIQDRVNSLYPDSNKAFSYYVRDLISKDINSNYFK